MFSSGPQPLTVLRDIQVCCWIISRRRGSDDQNGARRRRPKKIKTTKKKHPTAHDQKTIIPRLTPFWPLNGLNPPKRLPEASNWSGFFYSRLWAPFWTVHGPDPPKRFAEAFNWTVFFYSRPWAPLSSFNGLGASKTGSAGFQRDLRARASKRHLLALLLCVLFLAFLFGWSSMAAKTFWVSIWTGTGPVVRPPPCTSPQRFQRLPEIPATPW